MTQAWVPAHCAAAMLTLFLLVGLPTFGRAASTTGDPSYILQQLEYGASDVLRAVELVGRSNSCMMALLVFAVIAHRAGHFCAEGKLPAFFVAAPLAVVPALFVHHSVIVAEEHLEIQKPLRILGQPIDWIALGGCAVLVGVAVYTRSTQVGKKRIKIMAQIVLTGINIVKDWYIIAAKYLAYYHFWWAGITAFLVCINPIRAMNIAKERGMARPMNAFWDNLLHFTQVWHVDIGCYKKGEESYQYQARNLFVLVYHIVPQFVFQTYVVAWFRIAAPLCGLASTEPVCEDRPSAVGTLIYEHFRCGTNELESHFHNNWQLVSVAISFGSIVYGLTSWCQARYTKKTSLQSGTITWFFCTGIVLVAQRFPELSWLSPAKGKGAACNLISDPAKAGTQVFLIWESFFLPFVIALFGSGHMFKFYLKLYNEPMPFKSPWLMSVFYQMVPSFTPVPFHGTLGHKTLKAYTLIAMATIQVPTPEPSSLNVWLPQPDDESAFQDVMEPFNAGIEFAKRWRFICLFTFFHWMWLPYFLTKGLLSGLFQALEFCFGSISRIIGGLAFARLVQGTMVDKFQAVDDQNEDTEGEYSLLSSPLLATS